MGAVLAPLALRSSRLPPIDRGVNAAATLKDDPLVQSSSSPSPSLSPSPSPSPSSPPSPDPPPAHPRTPRVADLASDDVEIIQASLGRRTLLAALLAAGLTKPQAHRVADALADKKRLDHAGPKDAFTVARARSTGDVVAFEYATSPIDVWQARAAEPGGPLEPGKLDLTVETRHVAVGVRVGADLRQSLVDAGLDDDVLKSLDDAFEGRAELASVHAGARLRILATEERVDGEFARYASLDAVEYLPAHHAEEDRLRVYFYQRSGSRQRGGYYDAKGHQPYEGAWRSPLALARISSRFNPHRMHPVLHVVMPHNGVDFAAGPGTPVYATAPGTVRSAGDGGACGNMVQIAHANGLTSVYCHLSRFAPGLSPGQHVEARQLIAYVGATGRVTGPHLHFGVKRGDVFIDPLSLRLDGVRVLPREDRAAFAKRRALLDEELEAIQVADLPSRESDGAPPRGGQVGPAGAGAEPPAEGDTFLDESSAEDTEGAK
jgi:murein DD-endopeptidase MepM/ murein hydrolase activator NlpD